ncbi:peptidase [Mannheimia indoligenes]|uniref:peptidase n=1 Tax=Mannheimia indoligenes TaxID=3103145 RepID=UPI002FE618D5
MTQIEIFKAGKRYDANGKLIEITPEMLQQTVATYNPEFHEAPLVIGHPKSNHPAWGWVKALSLEDDVLKAEVDQLDTEFSEMVASGKFKKVSAAFYLPDSPNNPHKGVLSLRHVGFLGAKPPAVKGLKQVEFSEDDGFVEFSEWGQANLFSRLRDWLVSQFGVDEANKALPPHEVDWLKEDVMREQIIKQVQAEQVTPEPIFNEPAQPEGEPEMSAEEKAELERLKAENDKLKAEKAKAEAEKVEAALAEEKAGNAEFCEGLVKEGKLAPVAKEAFVQALNNLSELKAGREPEFNEGEDVVSQLKSAMSQSPQIIQFGEYATADKAQSQETDVVEYAEGTDPVAIEMDKTIRTYMKEHDVSYTAAFNAING